MGEKQGRQGRMSLPVRSPVSGPGTPTAGEGSSPGGPHPRRRPSSPPGSSLAGVFRPGSALPAQAHYRVFGPNTSSSLAQSLVWGSPDSPEQNTKESWQLETSFPQSNGLLT